MKVKTLNILTKAFESIERVIKYNLKNENRKFAKECLVREFENLHGYLATEYSYGTMKDVEFEESMQLVANFKIKMYRVYDII